MQAKCLIEFCQEHTTLTSRVEVFNLLCRKHQVRVNEALMLHLPRSLATTRHLFLNSTVGKTWFSDMVKLMEAVYRSRYHEGHPSPIKDSEGHFRQATADPLGILVHEETPSIKTKNPGSLAKPHPNPTSQVFKKEKK